MPVASRLLDRWKAWKMGGALCSEMEASTLYILSSIYRMRAAGIMLLLVNQEGGEKDMVRWTNKTRLLETSIEALKILIQRDRV
jgi:uridine phosphorylase